MSLPATGRRDRHGRGGPGGTAALLAVLLAVLVSLFGQTGSAYAVATNPAPTSSPKAAPEATPEAAPQPVAPKIDPKAEHAAAVKALSQSDLPDTCSGAIQSNTVYRCSAMTGRTSSFTFVLANPTDLVFIQTVGINNASMLTKLSAPDGSMVDCKQAYWDKPFQCRTSQAGSYTLQITNNMIDTTGFSVAFTPLFSEPGCTAIAASDRQLGAPNALHGSLAAGSSGNCYTLDGAAAGEVLRTSVSYWRATATVFDSTGTQVCTTNDSNAPTTSVDCALTGTAPYRILTSRSVGVPVDYDLTLARLSTPEGCPVLEPQAYGTVPDISSTARCRTLHVPTAGPYTFSPVTTGTYVSGTLFHPDGTLACPSSVSAPCTLAAGDYTWAVDGGVADAGAFGLSFNATTESRGCTVANDTGFSSGPATGSFSGPGERLCLTLPTATGNGIHLLNQPPVNGAKPSLVVYDAAGAEQCQHDGSFYSTCKLTGTAPFHVVLGGVPTGAYQLLVQRVGDGGGCSDWPKSGFGGSWGAQVSLTTTTQAACLSIPANQHSTAEMVDFSNISNRINASVQMFNAAGDEVCIATSTTTCVLSPGAPYSAILLGSGPADTYNLVRRDISSTASCPAPASTAVGGRSTTFTLTSDLDARCLRIDAAATDKLWVGVGVPSMSGNSPGAVLEVVDASGKMVCWQHGISCRVSGSTSYVVIVVASGYAGTPITTHVDAWRVGTAVGWAPECTANRVSADDFSLRSGTFTETSTGYCAVVQLKPSQQFGVYGTFSVAAPWVSLLGSTQWDGYSDYCHNTNSGDFSFSCQTSAADTGQAVLMVTPNGAATPAEYSMQGVCQQGCVSPAPTTLTSITPAAGQAGTRNQVVLHGTNLTLGTKVTLANNGITASSYPMSSPVSVSPDGTSLTLLLRTFGLTPGKYDLVLDSSGYTVGTPSPGYLPGAYTVTAAAAVTKSRFATITPTRFLDTRYGIGAKQARVGPGGVVPLQVAGVNGVPPTGVTAVVMNVTVVNPSQGGYLTVYPDGQPVPGVSNLNFTAGQTIPNLVTVPVVNGKVDLRNAFGTVDVIADATGYFSATGASSFSTAGPVRLLDTRSGLGARVGAVGPGSTVSMQVAGVNGVPLSGVTAVVLNVTVTAPTVGGFLTVYPHGQAAPGVSNLNFTAGQTISNLVVVPVVDGKVSFYNAFGTAHVVADLNGYYTS